MQDTWPATRWNLTAAESFVLLHGPSARPAEVLKLAVTELVARQALVLDTPRTGKPVVRDGPRRGAPRERVLAAVWDVYQATPTQSFAEGATGARLDKVAQGVAKQYGSLKRFVTAEVVQALVDRGLYERRETRILWIFPSTSYVLTPEGQTARASLEQWLAVGQQRLGEWSTDDPARALTYAGLAGAALLLMPNVYPDLARLRDRSTATSGGETGFVDGGDEGERDGGDDEFDTLDVAGFDLSGLSLDVFGSLESALSSIESSFDAGGFGGDGGGGDGGGGGGGDGGGGGGGGGGE